MTKTARPSAALRNQLVTRKSRMFRENAINVADTISTRIGYRYSTPSGMYRSKARSAMNTQNGARYGSDGYFSSDTAEGGRPAVTPNTFHLAPGWPSPLPDSARFPVP